MMIDLHSGRRADSTAEKAEAEQDRLLGAPTASLGLSLVETVSEEGDKTDERYGDEKDEIRFHVLFSFSMLVLSTVYLIWCGLSRGRLSAFFGKKLLTYQQ
jgi:hypothetical protein